MQRYGKQIGQRAKVQPQHMTRYLKKMRSQGKPLIQTDHLLTNFDKHYEQVLHRQLLKDTTQTQRKYYNCTEIGEGENKPQEQVKNNLNDSSEQQHVRTEDINSQIACSSGFNIDCGPGQFFDYDHQQVQKLDAGEFLSSEHGPGSYNYKASGAATSVRPREMLKDNVPGGGIVHYTISQKQFLIRSQQKRNNSSRPYYQRRKNIATGHAMSSKVSEAVITMKDQERYNDLRHSQSQGKNKVLLSRMLKDDEQFRDRLLRGYMGKVSSETQNSNPNLMLYNGMIHTNSGQIDPQSAMSGVPVVGRESNISPNNFTNIHKVQQIYQVMPHNQSPSGKMIDIATNHSSEAANYAFRQDEKVQRGEDGNDYLSVAQATNIQMSEDLQMPLELAVPSSTNSAIDGGKQIFQPMNLSKQKGSSRAAVKDSESIFHSLDKVKVLASGRVMTAGSNENIVYGQKRLRKRPITGARTIGKDKNQVFGFTGGGLLGQTGTSYYNQQSSADQYIGNCKTLSEQQKFRLLSGTGTGAETVDQPGIFQRRKQSEMHYITQPMNFRKSERNQTSSHLKQSSALAMNERAKSSVQSRKALNMNLAAKVTQQANERKNSLRNFSSYMSATELSQIPPRTNVPVLDNYFQQYDTVGQIGSIKFSTEFERLTQLIRKFWKLKGTQKLERDKVNMTFESMLARGEAHNCPEPEKQNMITSMNSYLNMMREYYDTEMRIQNLYQEREKVASDLIFLSQSFNLENFHVNSSILVLKLRMLSVQIVYYVRRWKQLVKRATATFTLGQARIGTDIGRQVTAQQRAEGNQKINSLKKSKSSHINNQDRPNYWRSTQEKFSSQYMVSQKRRDVEDRKQSRCILCHMFIDSRIQREGSILVKKLACFTTDSVVFQMKASAAEARSDIARMAFAFNKEPTFIFSEQEIACFEKLYNTLVPTKKERKHMEAALQYMQSHVCEEVSTIQAKPRQIEFNFNWEEACADGGQDGYQAPDSALSEVQWNFSNLDRSDRIHMVYNTLYDNMLKQSKNETLSRKNRQQYVIAAEHVIQEDSESQLIPVAQSGTSISSKPQFMDQSTSRQHTICAGSNALIFQNLDLREQLHERGLSQNQKSMAQIPQNVALSIGQQDDSDNKTQVVRDSNLDSEDQITRNQKSEGRPYPRNDIIDPLSVETEMRNLKSKTLVLATQKQKKETPHKEEYAIKAGSQVVPRAASNLMQAEISEGIDLFNQSQSNMMSQDSRLDHNSPQRAQEYSIPKMDESQNIGQAPREDPQTEGNETHGATALSEGIIAHSQPDVSNTQTEQYGAKSRKAMTQAKSISSKPNTDVARPLQNIYNQEGQVSSNLNDSTKYYAPMDKVNSQRISTAGGPGTSHNPSSSMTKVQRISGLYHRGSMQNSEISSSQLLQPLHDQSDNQNRFMNILDSHRASDHTADDRATEFANIHNVLQSMRDETSRTGITKVPTEKANSIRHQKIVRAYSPGFIRSDTGLTDKSPGDYVKRQHTIQAVGIETMEVPSSQQIEEDQTNTELSVEAQNAIHYSSLDTAIKVDVRSSIDERAEEHEQ